jgi:hypothetical protein
LLSSLVVTYWLEWCCVHDAWWWDDQHVVLTATRSKDEWLIIKHVPSWNGGVHAFFVLEGGAAVRPANEWWYERVILWY